jgi:PAS domain S-box-containing protein
MQKSKYPAARQPKKHAPDKADSIEKQKIKNETEEKMPADNVASAQSGSDLTSAWPGSCLSHLPENNNTFSTCILESIADGAFTVNHDFEITSFNRAAEMITGFKREEAIGTKCFNLFGANISKPDCPLKKSIETGKEMVNQKSIIKDIHGDDLKIAINTSVLKDGDQVVIGGVETFRNVSSLGNVRKNIPQKYNFQNIISKNSRIQKIFSTLPTIAKSTSTVLIEGESGSGKELFARAIHTLSSRKGPFVAINCAALPDTLLESELFGYKKGAFTGATKDKLGRFAMAENGTLFLDEIGDISPALQAKLLRVLQEKEYEPLGGTTTLKANVRTIAATNKKLKEQVTKGIFRSDLYFRLNVINIALPPFCKRREDLPLLVQHFIDKFRESQKKNIQAATPAVLKILMQYDFPGNIRELENIIEHCFVMCQDSIIDVGCLPEEIVESTLHTSKADESEANPLSNAEASAIWAALHKFNGHRGKTAAHLNIDKTTLWRKMKKYSIQFAAKKKKRANGNANQENELRI